MNISAMGLSKSALNGLLILLFLLNFLAGIVGGAWLLITGNWELVVYGILLSIVMPWAYTVAILPTFLLMPLIVKSAERKNVIFTAVLGFITACYTNGVIAYWAWYVFSDFVIDAKGIMAVPLLLWGYSTVMAPLGYMAHKEGDDGAGTSLGLLIAQVAFFIVMILWLLDGLNFVGVGLGLLVTLFAAAGMFIAVYEIKAEQRQENLFNDPQSN